MDQMKYDCNYSDFDIEQHKLNYVHYLEIIITPDGLIKYASPSHQEKLLSEICLKYNCSRSEAISKCPKDRHFEYFDWLTEESGCIAVWNDFYRGVANYKQKRMLLKLKQEGLYNGPFINDCEIW